MLLSRFWYAVLAVLLGGAIFLLYLATGVANRTNAKTGDQLLTAASRSVYWYLTDDGRQRATALIPLSLEKTVQEGLSKASKADDAEEVKKARDEVAGDVKSKLSAFVSDSKQTGTAFDAVWAVDIHGRVLANVGYEQGTGDAEFEMGGYALVADAIHGWIRDDAWVLRGQIYRVVGRPVEISAGGAPVGAIIGAKVIDDGFVQEISDKTGASVAFYAEGTRVAKGTPPNFDAAWLSVVSTDIAALDTDEDYSEIGRTKPRTLREHPGFHIRGVFARMPGEAWDVGAGYLVGHHQTVVTNPLDFQSLADQTDKDSVPTILVALIALGLVVVGLVFTVGEHTLPLRTFKQAVQELGDKRTDRDVLQPSTFRGVYKKIASDINDALDKVAAKAGVDRGPADLESVLGPLPAAPQMSAFSVPGAEGPASSQATPQSKPKSVPKPASSQDRAVPTRKRSLPKPPSSSAGQDEPPPEESLDVASLASPGLPASAGSRDDGPESGIPSAAAFESALRGEGAPPARPPADSEEDDQPTKVQDAGKVSEAVRRAVAAAESKAAAAAADDEDSDDDDGAPVDEETEWRKVYADFIAMKRKFGERTDKLTYEKFRGTLQRNKDALMARHGCERVKFRVYEKQGRAALKASPVK
ncbi:MAG: MXAN_5187 family protein [Polyangiaceae bacterium]